MCFGRCRTPPFPYCPRTDKRICGKQTGGCAGVLASIYQSWLARASLPDDMSVKEAKSLAGIHSLLTAALAGVNNDSDVIDQEEFDTSVANLSKRLSNKNIRFKHACLSYWTPMSYMKRHPQNGNRQLINAPNISSGKLEVRCSGWVRVQWCSCRQYMIAQDLIFLYISDHELSWSTSLIYHYIFRS